MLALDVALRRLYVASESGTVSVFDTSPVSPRKIGQGRLADAAHTVAVDQETHRVFLPLKDVRGRPALRVLLPGRGRVPNARSHGIRSVGLESAGSRASARDTPMSQPKVVNGHSRSLTGR